MIYKPQTVPEGEDVAQTLRQSIRYYEEHSWRAVRDYFGEYDCYCSVCGCSDYGDPAELDLLYPRCRGRLADQAPFKEMFATLREWKMIWWWWWKQVIKRALTRV